jgi:hypothetical protein
LLDNSVNPLPATGGIVSTILVFVFVFWVVDRRATTADRSQ